MKRVHLGAILLALLLGVSMLAGCGKAPVAQLDGQDLVKSRTLTVQGAGSVMTEPDIARITVGVMTSDPDAQSAQDQNDAVMAEVLSAIQEAGVAENDIQTTQYSAYPRYDYDRKTPDIIGFEVTHMITVIIRDIDTVGQVVKAANQAGANQSYNISFGIDDQEAAYQQALTKAIKNAKEKAKAMAAPAGVSLKEPAAIYEGSVPMDYGVTRSYGEEALYDLAGVPAQSGQLEIRAQVTIVYNIK